MIIPSRTFSRRVPGATPRSRPPKETRNKRVCAPEGSDQNPDTPVAGRRPGASCTQTQEVTIPSSGPVPKRSSERVRRNKPEVPIETLHADGTVEVPPLRLQRPRQLVVDMYDAMKKSAQSKYYEPTDWQFARITLALLDEQLKSSKPNSQVIAVIMSNFGDLLVSEGERRRARVEIERSGEDAPEVTDVAEVFRLRAVEGA